MSEPYLSIIIPAHNEEHRLPASLEKLDQWLGSQTFSSEVIVVENGSTDATTQVVETFQERYPYLQLIQSTRRGKGLAVKLGMLAATGQYRFLADADFSMPVEEISRFLPPQLEKADVAIASRELSQSERIAEPGLRHLTGRIFNAIVRWLVLPGLQDTQCGFKCFSSEAVQSIFPLQTLEGMSFDAEVLFIARRLGYAINEVPIHWYYDADSRVRLFEDSLKMSADLLKILRNARRGLYGTKKV